ncbi:hypothetical protein J6590_071282 [Homalodisca vitripennis]|nr:hypothetical protein J6590_071282 [Homalodisca vitripennis]
MPRIYVLVQQEALRPNSNIGQTDAIVGDTLAATRVELSTITLLGPEAGRRPPIKVETPTRSKIGVKVMYGCELRARLCRKRVSVCVEMYRLQRRKISDMSLTTSLILLLCGLQVMPDAESLIVGSKSIKQSILIHHSTFKLSKCLSARPFDGERFGMTYGSQQRLESNESLIYGRPKTIVMICIIVGPPSSAFTPRVRAGLAREFNSQSISEYEYFKLTSSVVHIVNVKIVFV